MMTVLMKQVIPMTKQCLFTTAREQSCFHLRFPMRAFQIEDFAVFRLIYIPDHFRVLLTDPFALFPEMSN